MTLKNKTLTALLFAILTLPLSAFAAEEQRAPPEKPETPEAKTFTSEHEISVQGSRVRYTATAGTLLLRDAKGEVVAEYGYTYYRKNGADPLTRPIMFAWNGGPGSASMWLHMGVLGPQRTVVDDLEINGRGPFKRVENTYSIIDMVDLVMVDPVGTGYSIAAGEAEGKDFWGVDNDIRTVTDFIAQFVSDNGRWSSPKFILGESYGGMRAGGVSYDLLTRYNIALNGAILVSPYMDMAGGGGVGVANMAIGYTMMLSGYAATAWFHEALENRPADLRSFVTEVDEFATGEYLTVMVKGARASDEERRAVAEKLGAYTGTSADYWLAANLRVTEGQFVAELLRKRGQLAGRIDSRFANYTTDALSDGMPYDPYMSSVGPAFVATFKDYYSQELGVKMDRQYVVSGRLWRDWTGNHRHPGSDWASPVADTGIDLAHAIIRNPDMKVLVQQGYYDLATPVRATEYFIDQMPLPGSLRDNVSIEYYEAGHMMYVHPPSLEKYREDLAKFIEDAL